MDFLTKGSADKGWDLFAPGGAGEGNGAAQVVEMCRGSNGDCCWMGDLQTMDCC